MNSDSAPVRRLRRQTSIEKPGVGRVHVHTGLLRRNHIYEVWFQPAGRERVYRVPDPLVESFFTVETFEQAMAVLRGSVEG